MKRVSSLEKQFSTDQIITGVEIPEWIEILNRNGWAISPQYLHRLAWVSAWSIPTTVAGRLEDAIYGRQLASMEIDPTPLVILGHWRSGTTHLHNLLGRDPNHTYSTVYQVVFPTSFLTTEKFVPALTQKLLPDKRTYDNVKHGWYEAAEDEIALAKLTGLSPYIAFMFPDHSAKYEKYIDFLEASDADRRKWKESFIYFVKKQMIQSGGKRVIVKSCPHSARIRLLLEMFPNAKFVHIHRNPYEVFASTIHMRTHTDWENFFQLPEENFVGQREEQVGMVGERIFRRLIEDRKLIPKENFVEIAYRDLAGNEIPVMRRIYEQFGLPDWAQYEAAITRYLDGIKGYQRNRLQLEEDFRDRVWNRWQFVFEEFGYPREYEP